VLSYPARLIPTADGLVMVRLPDVPEAAAFGDNEEEALANVVPILEAVLSAYCVDGRSIPSPSDICGAPTVATEKFSTLGLVIPDQAAT
jgi:antitoxin HicB